VIPLRVQWNDRSTVSWKQSKTLEHGDLCRALGVDPISHRFDLPKDAINRDRVVGASGYIFRHGEPVGLLHVVRESEKFRDLDPTNRDDQMTLRQTR